MSRDIWNGADHGDGVPLVPLYVLVNGRTSPRTAGLDLATQVIALKADTGGLEPEYDAIVKRCQTWISIAEISSYLKYPLTLTRILVDVLLERQFLAVGSPAQETIVDRGILEKILVRLKSL